MIMAGLFMDMRDRIDGRGEGARWRGAAREGQDSIPLPAGTFAVYRST